MQSQWKRRSGVRGSLRNIALTLSALKRDGRHAYPQYQVLDGASEVPLVHR